METVQSALTRVPSAWLTLVIFVLISHFNPEVLTGSTPIEDYFTFTNFLGMLFYGLQVAVVGDLAARYGFRRRTIFIVGLIYGIFEEGFAVMTMESPAPPGLTNVVRIAGLNIAWTMYISVFHAVISVLCSILIIRVIWPERISAPFLRRRHYALIIPVVAFDYFAFMRFVTAVYMPEASAIAILAVSCLGLAYLAKRSQSGGIQQTARETSYRLYGLSALVLSLLSGLVPYLLALSMVGGYIVPVLELVSGYLFTALFDRWEGDLSHPRRKGLILFAAFVGFWLVFSTFFRSPLSSLVAYGGVALQLYLGWRSVESEPDAPFVTERSESRPTKNLIGD